MKALTIEELRELDLFNELKDDTLYKLCAFGIKKTYKKGDIVFRDKEKVNTIYVVIRGKFSIYKIGEDAKRRVIYILGRDKILNDVILDDLPASINCEAFEEGELLLLNKNNFLSCMEEDFNLTKVVLNSLSIKVRRLYRQLNNTNPNKKIEKKIASKLWKLSKDYGIKVEEGTEIDLNISITYLADMLGSQRETISRSLKLLEEKDLIRLNNRKIIVKDKDELARFFKGL
ncbi:Crp/Fnr family transcriptional regulator [Clostridium algidicarnis]|uniref:Crp/Fnr family transcriptional regulator n=1 Tax=Clostridium algidicarnis TaxID=37659 RepID=UPI001C0D779D|nr:Crp/Fnr family transcriptional regulator [Clostridium algidicarnis]MBU3227719.1 Crp/Fnr family transcriptional regulator [Clostridium algidicarnis]MBU3251471.1 Crp/Fnr family transcriptional regulator [Clostridium algidicarnis]